MGRYCDVQGTKVEFIGLLEQAAETIIGIGRCLDREVVLSYKEIEQVQLVMREAILGNWANRTHDRYPLANKPLWYVQDIILYADDILSFKALSLWLAYNNAEQELVWV